MPDDPTDNSTDPQNATTEALGVPETEPPQTEQPETEPPLSLEDLAGGLDFAPSWAKGGAEQPVIVRQQNRGKPGARKPRATGRRHDATRNDRPERRPEQARRTAKPGGSRMGPRRADTEQTPQATRRPLPPLRIRFVPDDKRLAVLVNKIHSSHRAFPLKGVLSLVLSRPEACRAKLEISERAPEVRFHFCRKCGLPSTARDDIARHVLAAHMDDYFETVETEHEAPSGTFVCVLRCGLSGCLLGPPNHNSVNDRIQELHATRYPEMSIDAYRKRIETLHDPELIEQWKEETRKQTRYRRKDDAAAEPVSYLDAVDFMANTAMETLVQEGRRTIMQVKDGESLPDHGLRDLVFRAWKHEQRHPRSIVFALKAAFKHMQLHVFTCRDGEELVCSIRPTALDSTHVAPGIQDIMNFIHANPDAKRDALAAHLETLDEGDGSTRIQEAKTALSWLIEKGHIVERFDGTLHLPPQAPAAAPSTDAEAPKAPDPATEA